MFACNCKSIDTRINSPIKNQSNELNLTFKYLNESNFKYIINIFR